MDTRLDCEIVRDLLPSYVDGLTSGVTNRAVEAHIESCSGCTEALRRMREPERRGPAPPAELDYLKKVRRRSGRKAVLSAAGAAVLILALICIWLFALGNEAGPAGVNYSAYASGNAVYFSGSLPDSGNGVSRVTFAEEEGTVTVRLYTAPKTFFNSREFSGKYEAKGEVTQIRFGGLIAWENGTQISRLTAQLYAAKNPYVGDMPANGRIAALLGVGDRFQNYTNELQTSEEPYGWKLILGDPIAAEEEEPARSFMKASSCAMLALIDNLGYVTWEYRTPSGPQSYTVTASDASAFAGTDIKLCAVTATDLQKLMKRLSTDRPGVNETLQEEGTFRFSVTNRSDSDLSGIVIRYYLDGNLTGTASGGNADGSALAPGETIVIGFEPKDFPEGTGAGSLYSGFSFDLAVVDRDGRETLVRQGLSVAAKYAWTYFFTLTGSYEDGFVLNEG